MQFVRLHGALQDPAIRSRSALAIGPNMYSYKLIVKSPWGGDTIGFRRTVMFALFPFVSLCSDLTALLYTLAGMESKRLTE